MWPIYRRRVRAAALGLIGLLLGQPLPPATLQAQAAEAAILGQVVDSTGAPLPGAIVEATHAETGLTLRLTTNRAGRFAFLQVPLGGPYTVRARLVGYAPERVVGLILTLGARPELRLRLPPAPTTLTRLDVRADTTGRRDDRIGGSVRVSTQQLQQLPVPSRNFADLAQLSPLAGPQTSLGGARWTSTDFRIDGAQSRNMLRAGEANGGPYGVSMEAIREFEVNTNVYDVTLGRQGGGQVSAATRFGTNQWTGTLFSHYRSDRLGAATDFQQLPRAARPFTTVQAGGSAGGPLVRDKVHLFGAFERQDGSQPLLVGDVGTPAAQQAAGIASDSLRRILDILGSRYGTSDVTRQLGQFARRPVSTSLFGRLDWTLSERHRLTVRHNWSRWQSPLSGGVDQPLALRESRSDFNANEHQALATLRSTLSASAQHELRVAWSTASRALVPASPGVPRGFVQVRSALSDGSIGNSTVQFGGNRLAPDGSREWQAQLTDHLYMQRGTWLFTLGTDNTFTRATTTIAEAQSGLFVFPSIAALAAGAPNRFQRSVPLTGTTPTTRQEVLELSAYAQAEWRPAARVSLLGGARWDANAFLTAPHFNPLVEQALGLRTDRRPVDWLALQPRAQLIWDVTGRGRDLVRVGGGRFVSPVMYYLQHNQLLHTGLQLADIDVRSDVPAPDFRAFRADPTAVPGVPVGTLPPAFVNVVGDSYRQPTTWKGSASYQRRVGERLMLTGSLLHARTSGNYHYLDRNLVAQPIFTLANEGGRGVYVPAVSIPAGTGVTANRHASVDARLARTLSLESIGRAKQLSAVAELAASPWRGGALTASYTWNRARDNSTFGCCLARTAGAFTPVATDPRNLAAAWGPSDLDIRHRLVATLLTRLPSGVELSGRYVGTSGRPFSLVVDGDVNGDEANSNDLAFLFDPDDSDTPADLAASMRRVLANPANRARRYMAANLGHVSTRNGARTAWSHRMDLRVARPIAMGTQQSLELTVDLFNALNLIDPAWGSTDQLPFGISAQNPLVNRLPLLRIVGFDPVAQRYRYQVNEQAGVLPPGGDPWVLQAGVRWRW